MKQIVIEYIKSIHSLYNNPYGYDIFWAVIKLLDENKMIVWEYKKKSTDDKWDIILLDNHTSFGNRNSFYFIDIR